MVLKGSVNFGPRGSTALGFGGHAHRTFPAVRLYGVKVDSLPEVFKGRLEQIDDRLVDRVISYIFESERNVKSKSVWKHRVNLAKRAFKDRWKFREIYGMSMWRMLWMRMKGMMKGE